MRQVLPQKSLGIETLKLCDTELNINNWATCFPRLSFSRIPGSGQSDNSVFASSVLADDVTVILH